MRIYLDIETIPSQRADVIERAASMVKVPGNYKNEDSIAQYRADHADEAWHRTALDGGYGELCCIGIAIEDEPVQSVYRTDVDESELDLLGRWFALLEPVARQHQSLPLFIGHNIGFDLRFLHHRSVVHGVKPPVFLPYNSAAWQGKYVDTMYEWCGARDSVKLTELCQMLHIDVQDAIDGSEVWSSFQAGDITAIVEHCEADVERVRQIDRMLRYLPKEG